MAKFTPGFKAKMIQRMAGPEGISANALSVETSVGQPTLSRWLRDARTLGTMKKKQSKEHAQKPRRRTAEDKFRIVLEAASLSDDQLGEFLRREGIHASQLEEWRETARAASTGALKDAKRKKSEQTPEARKIRELESELRRKDKALAEAAALLILQKKMRDFWAAKDDDTTTGKDRPERGGPDGGSGDGPSTGDK